MPNVMVLTVCLLHTATQLKLSNVTALRHLHLSSNTPQG